MPGPTRRPTAPARPVVSAAELTARGRRTAERKARQHQRARERRAERGEAELWLWAPAIHAGLIRDLAAEICTALHRGLPPEEILALTAAAEARIHAFGLSAGDAGAGSPGCGVGEDSNDAAASAGADDPAILRGQGWRARRRGQARRAAARKKAAGKKRLRLVVPAIFKLAISRLVDQVLAGLRDGRVHSRAEATLASAEAGGDCFEREPRAQVPAAVHAPAGTGSGGRPRPGPAPGGSCSSTWPWSEGAPAPGAVENHVPLFEDIRALDNLIIGEARSLHGTTAAPRSG